jgi:uncharacterized short protein YbdD (DUF466 family)
MQRGTTWCYDCRVNNSLALPPLLVRIGAVLRRIIGAPDYERYVRHVGEAHPGETPVSAEEFYRAQTEGKYTRPGTRCC